MVPWDLSKKSETPNIVENHSGRNVTSNQYFALVIKFLINRVLLTAFSATFYTLLFIPIIFMLVFIPGGIQLILLGSGKAPFSSVSSPEFWMGKSFEVNSIEMLTFIGVIVVICGIIGIALQKTLLAKYHFPFKKRLAIVSIISFLEYPVLFSSYNAFGYFTQGKGIKIDMDFTGFMLALSLVTIVAFLAKEALREFLYFLSDSFFREKTN